MRDFPPATLRQQYKREGNDDYQVQIKVGYENDETMEIAILPSLFA